MSFMRHRVEFLNRRHYLISITEAVGLINVAPNGLTFSIYSNSLSVYKALNDSRNRDHRWVYLPEKNRL